MITNEFGEDAVRLVAGTLWFWETLDPNGHLMIRQFGFRDPEIPKRCNYRAIAEATSCLEQIPDSIPVLIGELGSENATLRATAAVELLIDRLADGDKKVVAAASSALKRITGKSFLFAGSDPRKWREWWNKSKGGVAK